LLLAGSYGDIFAPGFLRLWSDHNVYVTVDANNDGLNQDFTIFNGGGSSVLSVDEGGDLWILGTLSEAAAGFKIDHPLDPANKYLQHSFVGSSDVKSVYDGVVQLDADGTAWVELPAWFEALNKDFRYQLTPIGAPGPNLHVAREIQDNRLQIAGGAPGMRVSWQVTGNRHDPYAKAHPLRLEEDKLPQEQGSYLHPVEHGQPEAARLNYQAIREGTGPGGEP
jgi:hypothetical protein